MKFLLRLLSLVYTTSLFSYHPHITELGDRFIPNRSLMNLDQAHTLLTNRINAAQNPNFGEAYRQRLMDCLTMDSEGRPFRMLVFRGSPKSSRKSIRHIDEMRKDDSEALSNVVKPHHPRRLPKKETRILDAPAISNDFYTKVMDWGKNNVVAVALNSAVYLWNAESCTVQKLLHDTDRPTSLCWSEDCTSLAVGFMHSKLQVWDAKTSVCVRDLKGHKARVGAISWNGQTLTSGSKDKFLIHHDVRQNENATVRIKAHNEEVCGLKWSSGGSVLASGGNDNIIYIWEASKMSSSKFLHKLNGHSAAVKALAWCPYQFNVLASGGGTSDGCIKIWNTRKGTCIGGVDTGAQICGLEWNTHHQELLSAHGYGMGELQNHLCLWKYPSMTKLGQLCGHRSRVLNTSQSPDGLTVLSAGGDETLRFWEIFGPARAKESRVSNLDSLLSLKTSPIR
ncbi:hypothetical protein K2173_027673 [Erythroxylum novogranatense]|uniref:CDC20/Fizzy WD40 domain-containing protein n=1 Tax=Erythroxylum novogranatense TaxID=1862640 RepID=A0AAV8TZQ1_9ROSI|nr:hypothetical protein K2173_027673 [Erythroxylum novogranatense]